MNYDNYGIEYYPEQVDLDGVPVRRNKFDFPYSYDPFVVWARNFDKLNSDCVYSDRLMQWDMNKFNECCKKAFGDMRQGFTSRNPYDIQSFLSDYLGRNIQLTAIMEGCNVSSGYPYWIFFYDKEERKPKYTIIGQKDGWIEYKVE